VQEVKDMSGQNVNDPSEVDQNKNT